MDPLLSLKKRGLSCVQNNSKCEKCIGYSMYIWCSVESNRAVRKYVFIIYESFCYDVSNYSNSE